MDRQFKNCSCCGTTWTTREAFLRDDAKKLIGYQSNFKDLELGIILFNCCCGTTLALEVRDFIDLFQGEIFKDKKTGTDVCPGFCLNEQDLETCPAKCKCAYVREVLQMVG